MEKVYIGKIVSTHGIKGELKIISDFPYKNKVFKVNNYLLINDEKYLIKSYRHHKIYDMVTLNDYKDINEVQFLIKKKVYVLKESLKLNEEEILDEDLIKYEVISNKGSGKIEEIFLASPKNKILRIKIDNHELLIPVNSPYIEKIDKKSETVYIKIIDGMILWK